MPRPAPVISQVFVMALTVDPRKPCKGVLSAPLSASAAQAWRRLRARLGRMDRRHEIREFLMTRRGRVTPEQAGLYVLDGDVRRVPGLRREEVADLAGVSAGYYTQLARGDAGGGPHSGLSAGGGGLGPRHPEPLPPF